MCDNNHITLSQLYLKFSKRVIAGIRDLAGHALNEIWACVQHNDVLQGHLVNVDHQGLPAGVPTGYSSSGLAATVNENSSHALQYTKNWRSVQVPCANVYT